MPSYAVGIINFHSYACLERCLESVAAQTMLPTSVMVVDNDPEPDELEAARERHPHVTWVPSENRGYAASANLVLAHEGDGADFVLILNPDVDLAPGFAENLVAAMAQCETAALGSGKLLRPDSGAIDSAGIVLPRHRRPRDRGSEERDRGQYDRREFVFGVTGAALMIRASALEDLTIEGEVFDEDFFMYHEETDLAWRAHLLGWQVLYVPGARGYHARNWRRDRRFEIPAAVRRHSFKNHYLQLIKNERASDLLVNLPAIALWELMRLTYALARDPSLLRGYRDAWQLAGRAWRKRRILHDRARPRARGAGRSLARLPRSATVPGVDRGDEQAGQPAV